MFYRSHSPIMFHKSVNQIVDETLQKLSIMHMNLVKESLSHDIT